MAAVELNSTSFASDGRLVYYWRFEANSNSTVGSSNGTDTNMSYSSTGAKFGNAAQFNGTSAYITFSSFTQPTSAYTISCWLTHASSSVDENKPLLDSQNSGDLSTGVVFVYNPNRGGGGNSKRLRCYHNNGSWSETDNLGSTLEDGNSHHVGLTWDGSSHVFYVDGSAVKTNAYSTAITNWGQARVGNRTTSNQYISGTIDDYAVFNDDLTAAEMLEIATGPSTSVKTYNGLATSSVKTTNGLAIASRKTKNGLA